MNQQALEESVEKMGMWFTRHPSGTLVIEQGGEQFTVFPHKTRWTYRLKRVEDTQAYNSGFFSRKDVELLVHKILTWGWSNGANVH